MLKGFCGIILVVWFFSIGGLCPAERGLAAWWKFDEASGKVAIEGISGRKDSIEGNFRYVEGVSGGAVKFDGFTTRIIGGGTNFTDGFTIEAWIAAQAYPWNFCAIIDHQKDRKKGYAFGIDEAGRVVLGASIDGKWRSCRSEASVGFMGKWSHVVGTFSSDGGIVVFVDGEPAGKLGVKGKLEFADDVDLLIGRNREKMKMKRELLVRPKVNFPLFYSFDGIIDELKLYDRALSPEQIRKEYENNKPKGPAGLKWRKLPRIPAGDGTFGAVYCRLKFYPEWDALWRVADHPDIVVNFDEGPYKMVFWRGTNYNMNLVTENGKWVGDQSAEKSGGGTIGCCEHMSDKQCRYAHVRLIENHDARVVVHWRYALNDVLYKIAREDRVTGWGAWADEYYYIYPDGAAVRYFRVHGVRNCSITEPAALNNPGEKAEDNLHVEAITMANMAGEIRSFSWDPWPNDGRKRAPFDNALEGANISIVNFKSVSKPYYIYEPGTRIIPFGGGTKELRTEYSKFPTWNHWPTSMDPSDGHYPVVADRVSSSAVTSPEPPMSKRDDGSIEGRFIMGLTDKPIEKLSSLARSWLHCPQIKMHGAGFVSEGYSRDQRAYMIEKHQTGTPKLEFELLGSNKSPVVNPAFVIKNWNNSNAAVKVDGKELKRGKVLRIGVVPTLEGSDLVVWLKVHAEKPVRILLSPVSE